MLIIVVFILSAGLAGRRRHGRRGSGDVRNSYELRKALLDPVVIIIIIIIVIIITTNVIITIINQYYFHCYDY